MDKQTVVYSHSKILLNNKNESSVCEIIEKEQEIHASFAVAPQTAKGTATVCDESLGWKKH